MSMQGVSKVASIFQAIQMMRNDLIQEASKPENVKTPSGHQDLELAQLLEEIKDFSKEKFSVITMRDV